MHIPFDGNVTRDPDVRLFQTLQGTAGLCVSVKPSSGFPPDLAFTTANAGMGSSKQHCS